MLLREGVRDWDGFQAMVSRMALASASEMWRSSGPGGLACAARGVGRGAGGVVGVGVEADGLGRAGPEAGGGGAEAVGGVVAFARHLLEVAHDEGLEGAGGGLGQKPRGDALGPPPLPPGQPLRGNRDRHAHACIPFRFMR